MRLVQTTDPKPVELLIAKFAAKHNLKAQKDKGDDTQVIFGRSGQIYQHSDKCLGVIYSDSKDTSAHSWLSRMEGAAQRVRVPQADHGSGIQRHLRHAVSDDPNDWY
jgi:hypothetical protein